MLLLIIPENVLRSCTIEKAFFRTPHTLWVEVKIGTATVEKDMRFP